MIRISPVTPEAKLSDAQRALDKAKAKFEAAVDHGTIEATRQNSEIAALSTVISDKRDRVSELGQLTDKARAVASAIVELLTDKPNA